MSEIQALRNADRAARDHYAQWPGDQQPETPRGHFIEGARFGAQHVLDTALAAAERRGEVRALREAAEALSRQPSTCKSPGCHRADQIILEERADELEVDS